MEKEGAAARRESGVDAQRRPREEDRPSVSRQVRCAGAAPLSSEGRQTFIYGGKEEGTSCFSLEKLDSVKKGGGRGGGKRKRAPGYKKGGSDADLKQATAMEKKKDAERSTRSTKRGRVSFRRRSDIR